MKNKLLHSLSLLSVVTVAVLDAGTANPALSNGVKIGEVTQDQALVWVRLTAPREPTMETVAPGVPGKVQIIYRAENDGQSLVEMPPVAVDPAKDFTCQIPLNGLEPNTRYEVKVSALSESGAIGESIVGQFKTAPRADQIADVEAVVVTCQGHETIDHPEKGHWVYSHMLTHQPDFFIHTGDVVYYDKGKAYPLSKTVKSARERWNRMFTYDWNRDFNSQVSSYFMKDDHDTLKNDCWPGQKYGDLTFEDGLALFKEQTPQGELPYRRVRWGKDLEFWMIEGRDYRSPNQAPDGPEKTILGEAQKAWLKETLQASDATFKLVVFPSPIVGPDKGGKNDNHANEGFSHEGDELREFLSGMPNTYVVCGDRHWQYGSKDPVTGLVEICCGPINNAHAKRGGNADEDKDYHLYYGGGRGGYLKIKVTRDAGTPKISFIWYGDKTVDGQIHHQLEFSAGS